MTSKSAAAVSHPNIAFIKYWGNRDQELRIPSNGSISMNLAGLTTHTRVTFDASLPSDELIFAGRPTEGAPLARVSAMLDRVRRLAHETCFARVESENNFPAGAGIASSASAFAALALAATQAAGLSLSERDLSRLARTGSGSASRSIPAGFVEWQVGLGDEDSFAYSIAPPEHWPLVDCVAVLSQVHKPTGSSEGHPLAESSPLQAARVADTPRRLEWCRRAIQERDFEAMAAITELDSNLMHAVMMTSSPILFYWEPGTLALMQAVQEWRRAGLPVFYTVDAGPNVHVLCPAEEAGTVQARLEAMPGVDRVLFAPPGEAARRVD